MEQVESAVADLERYVARFDAVLDTLTELGLIDKYSSASFCEQIREKLAARDAAQQKLGAVAALRDVASMATQNAQAPIECLGGEQYRSAWVVLAGFVNQRADAIERGEVQL